jgi:hypothetical protein
MILVAPASGKTGHRGPPVFALFWTTEVLRSLRASADELRKRWRGRKAVLLGRDVAAAFRLYHQADYDWFQVLEIDPGVEVAVMPHPSGTSSWWNERVNVEAATKFTRRLMLGYLVFKRTRPRQRTSGRKEGFRDRAGV